MFVLVMICVVMTAFANRMTGPGTGSVAASTANRERIETGIGYDNNCIVDELGWFENIPKTSRRLQGFYDATGVQPYIYLKSYDPDLISDDEKLAYAESWYEDNIPNEGTFLFMYFAEANQDGDVGYMTYVNGKQIGPVMDAEAVEIFWNYVDNNWYSDLSTDDMFVRIFDSTANRIMTRTATGADAVKSIAPAVIIIAIGAVAVVVLNTKRKHARERAAETERILNADVDKIAPEHDSTLDRWS